MSEMRRLRVRLLENVISTDDIIPGRYKHMYTDSTELARHVFENILPEFAQTILFNDVICCKKTFGIGSSREQAVSSLIASGVQAVIAPNFGRIFFRNAWNLGLPAIEIKSFSFREGEIIYLDIKKGFLFGDFKKITFPPPPVEILRILESGGLLNYLKKSIKA